MTWTAEPVQYELEREGSRSSQPRDSSKAFLESFEAFGPTKLENIGRSKVAISEALLKVTETLELKVIGKNYSLAELSCVGVIEVISDSVMGLERTRRGKLVVESRPSCLRLRL